MQHSGKFGRFGGCFVPEILVPPLEQLEEYFYRYVEDPHFLSELNDLLETYAGRPTPLYLCRNLVENGRTNFLKARRSVAWWSP